MAISRTSLARKWFERRRRAAGRYFPTLLCREPATLRCVGHEYLSLVGGERLHERNAVSACCLSLREAFGFTERVPIVQDLGVVLARRLLGIAGHHSLA